MIRDLDFFYMNGISYVFYMFDCVIWDVIKDLVYVYMNGIDHVFYTYQLYLWLNH